MIRKSFPHCDARIVHRPGKCDVCDKYASDLQELRKVWQIAFTGEEPVDLTKTEEPRWLASGAVLPCPADFLRGDTHKQWGGNTAKSSIPANPSRPMEQSMPTAAPAAPTFHISGYSIQCYHCNQYTDFLKEGKTLRSPAFCMHCGKSIGPVYFIDATTLGKL